MTTTDLVRKMTGILTGKQTMETEIIAQLDELVEVVLVRLIPVGANRATRVAVVLLPKTRPARTVIDLGIEEIAVSAKSRHLNDAVTARAPVVRRTSTGTCQAVAAPASETTHAIVTTAVIASAMIAGIAGVIIVVIVAITSRETMIAGRGIDPVVDKSQTAMPLVVVARRKMMTAKLAKLAKSVTTIGLETAESGKEVKVETGIVRASGTTKNEKGQENAKGAETEIVTAKEIEIGTGGTIETDADMLEAVPEVAAAADDDTRSVLFRARSSLESTLEAVRAV